MYFLLVDTATKYLCVAIAKDGKVLASYKKKHEKTSSQLLLPSIEKLLHRCRLSLKDINCLGADRGPGSFTGIRIGLAAIKGLGLALGVPAIGFSSLDVLAFNLRNKKNIICPIIDAKRNQVYSAFYEIKQNKTPQRISAYFLGPLGDVFKKVKGRVVFTGDAVGIFQEQIKKTLKEKAIFAQEKFWYPNCDSLAKLGYEMFHKKMTQDVNRLSALYLYPNTCTVQKK